MSLGSFVRGAFQGYEFGEQNKDRKTQRKRNAERFDWERDDQEWRGESRERERENWDYTDTVRGRQRDQWSRQDQQREEQEATEDELERIRTEGYEDWKEGQGGQPVPANTPQGTVRAPLDPAAGPRQPTTGSTSPSVRGVNVPGLSERNPNAAPLRFGDDVPRMENRPIRVPLSRGDDTQVGDMGDDMLLTDIEPVKGRYSEEEQQDTARARGALGMPVDPRAPRGPEAGQPQRQAARNARTVLGDAPETQAANVPSDTQDDTGTLEAPQTPERSTEQAAGPVRDVDPNATAFVQDVQELMRQGDISSAQQRIVQGLATGEYGAAGSAAARAIGGVRDYFTASQEEGEANAAERRKTAGAIEWYQSDEARTLFEQNPDMLAAAAADPIGFIEQKSDAAGPTQPQAAPQPGQGAASAAEPPRQPAQGQPPAQTPGQAPAQQPQGSGAGQPVYGGMTASQAAQFQNLPEPRMALEDGGEPISMVRDSLASNANADNNGETPQVSEQERAQGAATFREYYQSQVVPRQIDALYQRGEIEAAEQLQTWLEDERSQGVQENYARAVHAASVGDERGFFDHLGKVYNNFDDGYRFIADESDLYKNDAGATMAKITLENTNTGERFTQEYEGGEELIQQVLTQMDPISIFQTLKGQAEAEAAAAAEQQAWEVGESRRRIKEGYETPADRRKVFTDAYSTLAESSPNWFSMSPEEKDIAIADFLARQQSFATGSASGPQAPVYLGD